MIINYKYIYIRIYINMSHMNFKYLHITHLTLYFWLCSCHWSCVGHGWAHCIVTGCEPLFKVLLPPFADMCSPISEAILFGP